MKITKYEHACVVLEEDASRIAIDIGKLSNTFTKYNLCLDAVIYTHIHGDHFDKELLVNLLSSNPTMAVYAPQQVIDQLQDVECSKKTIYGGIKDRIGAFSLEFTGVDHAIIYKQVPCQNSGVYINNGAFYYPGDSFVLPPAVVKALAVPASAPWMKTSEAIDFMSTIRPKIAFATHTGLLSAFGEEVTYNWLSQSAATLGMSWRSLQVEESIDLS